MSKVTLNFNSIPQWTDTVTITVNNGVSDIPRNMSAVQTRLAYGQYEIDQAITDPLFWAANFVTAWNIDHKDLGGTNNLKATVIGSGVVEINLANNQWQFVSVLGTSISFGRISEATVNDPVPSPTYYDHTLTGADCTYANYTVTIFGGVAPYTIKGLPGGDLTGVAASSPFQLQRGVPATVVIEDSSGDLIQSKSITPPRNLKTGHFTIIVTPENGANTANVAPNIVIESDILPIEYSLDGVTYSETSSFGGLLFDSNFTMYIRDAYGCVLTKDFVTLSDNGSTSEQSYTRYFKISNAGTLIFKEYNTERKNLYNTLSCEELASVPYGYVHEFIDSDTIVQQFKSSYGYHKITLMQNGVATFIQPILQHENLNQVEKVDGKLFKTATGLMGLYFNGGNTYVANSTTVLDVSTYSASSLPSWAVVGQVVAIDGVGNKEIKRITTDSQRGLYLEFSDSYTSLVDVDVKVQANYNRQDYNLYEFALPMSSVVSGRIIIEAGFNDLVERTFVSELINNIEDDERRLLHEWNDPENKSGIVHQTGIKSFARLYTKLHHKTLSTSELYNGDNETFNLDQQAQTAAELQILVNGFGMENKLALASGMENYSINGINYKKETWESEIIGNSNVYEIKGVLRLGGNDLEVNADEIVLKQPDTPLTDKPAAPVTIPSYLAIDVDGLVLNGGGGFIQLA